MPSPSLTAAPPGKRLAVFDLDGTISRHDTYLPFALGLLLRSPGRWLRLPLFLGSLLSYLTGRIDRGALKGALLHQVFRGMSRTRMQRWAQRFAAGCVPHRLHMEGMAAVARHLEAGDHVVLLSASPDLYVPFIGQLLRVHETHCTQIRWHADRLDGRLAGPNRRDHEKARVLEALRAAHPGLPVIAYGNSDVDLIHMRQCEQAVYVNAAPHEADALRAEGIRCVLWK